MNRRRFLQSLVAVFSLPANASFAFRAAPTATPAAVVVPAQARSWAVYMSTLHGECTPQTLQNLLHIPAADAKRYVTQLIADGALAPNPLLRKSISNLVKGDDENLLSKLKKRLEMKADAGRTDEVTETEIAQPPSNLEADSDETKLIDDQPAEFLIEEMPISDDVIMDEIESAALLDQLPVDGIIERPFKE